MFWPQQMTLDFNLQNKQLTSFLVKFAKYSFLQENQKFKKKRVVLPGRKILFWKKMSSNRHYLGERINTVKLLLQGETSSAGFWQEVAALSHVLEWPDCSPAM